MINAATGTINYDELLLKPAVFEAFVLTQCSRIGLVVPVLAYSP